ncbi:TVP38/TMEM64 family protein [Methyloligella sp. 2.7D]|uniref:TVP38/TMEM64 family protein n=1 Tax=unclassified Methyloligella TaxID=2625955 RepID=UPI00157C0F7D|nr:TVP38/TMEM64 family protein [Methyloligella sp. GL2]QKP78544.1 TVP38/TMEM64 family protein [Methyloligella sp. GL2]
MLTEPASSGKLSLKRLWPLILLVAAAGLVFALGGHRYLTLQQLAAHREALRGMLSDHLALTLAAYIAVYAVSVALSLPGGAVLTLAGGFLFGWFWGGMAALVAASIGAVIVFLIAKGALGEALIPKVDTPLDKFRKNFQEDAFSYLLFLRLVPVFPFWLVNLAPGLLGVSFRTYTLATVIGIIPGTFAFSIAGAGLDSVIAAQTARCAAETGTEAAKTCLQLDASSFLTPQLVAGFVALGLLAFVPVIVKRLRKTPY